MFRALIFIGLSVSAVAQLPQQGYSCLPNQLQCRDGSCVSFGSHCDDGLNYTNGTSQPGNHRERRQEKPITELCVLPQYPKEGTYRVANVPDAYPTQSFQSLLLTVSCRRGYGVVAADDYTNAIGGHVYCINGVWQQKMPKCVRFCKVNPDPSVRYMCHVQGTGFKPCGKIVAPGTTVKPVCNNLYHSDEELPYMKCISGFWDYLPHCKADCGLITPEGEQLIIGGELAKRGELPWHVGIYNKSGDSYQQICGGSLITNNVVISAAHCFWNDRIKVRPASEFAVGIGKLYREWDNDMDVAAQKSDVKDIKIPTLFKGEATNFQEDIAVVILMSSFVYKPYVRPVCMNFDTNFDTYQLQHGKFGKVAGWGLTSVTGVGSQILKVVSLPYIKVDTCIDTLPPSFAEYITSDKFCAGYTNGTALCKGDSGGGLAFAEREQGRYRYYLRGVVSTAPRHDENECNDATLTTFTKIKRHEEFIKSSLAASVNKTCPWYLFQCKNGACVDQGADCNGVQDCTDGSDEAAELCTPDADVLDELSDRACVFPKTPSGSFSYILNTSSMPEPGRILKSFAVLLMCARYNYLLGPELRLRRSNNEYIVMCIDGKWSAEMPICLDYCDALDIDYSLFYRCRHPERNTPMVCHKYRKPGLPCSPNDYTDFVRPDPEIKCPSNSSKDGFVNCKTDCGKVTYLKDDKGQVGGKPVKREYMPWHVSIYEKSGKDYLYHCGGTLISNNVVLSAADRFWDEEKGYIRYSEWGAAAGQIYRLWDDEKNIHAQTSDVKGITLPDSYAGRSRGFQSDIAVLIVVPFVLNTYVKHVCLDWNAELEEKHLNEDNIGKIAGWGRSSKDSPLRQEVLQLNNSDLYTCTRFLQWKQDDQICSRFTIENLQFLNSNLGSGLVFAHTDSGVERFYLRGILTTRCLKDDLCYIHRENYLATFTNLSHLKNFIKKYTLL